MALTFDKFFTAILFFFPSFAINLQRRSCRRKCLPLGLNIGLILNKPIHCLLNYSYAISEMKWKELLFRGRLSVDSVNINAPVKLLITDQK